MAQRDDNASRFGNGLGYGVNASTGALEPAKDSLTPLGTAGPAVSAMRWSDVVAEQDTIQSDGGVRMVRKVIEEDITLATGALTTDSTKDLLPIGIIDLIHAEVLETVATATGWALGDATVAARFLASQTGAQLTAGAVAVGMAHWFGVVSATNAGPTQAAAAKLRVTAATGNASAGKLRVTVFYRVAEKAA